MHSVSCHCWWTMAFYGRMLIPLHCSNPHLMTALQVLVLYIPDSDIYDALNHRFHCPVLQHSFMLWQWHFVFLSQHLFISTIPDASLIFLKLFTSFPLRPFIFFIFLFPLQTVSSYAVQFMIYVCNVVDKFWPFCMQ